MNRTTMALLLVFALTGCRFLEQSRHAAANQIAAAVVRGLFAVQSSAPVGPTSRPLDRPGAPLAIPSPRPAAAAVVVTAPPVTVMAAAAARGPLLIHLRLCRSRSVVHLDENGNASL